MINIALVSIYFVVIFRYRFTRFLFGIANFYTFILIPLLHLPSHSFSFHHFPIVQMSVHSFVSSSSTAYEPKVLMSQAIKVASLFELSDGYLQKAVDSYISQANESLAVDSERGIPMIPSYVSCTPSGKKGRADCLWLGRHKLSCVFGQAWWKQHIWDCARQNPSPCRDYVQHFGKLYHLPGRPHWNLFAENSSWSSCQSQSRLKEMLRVGFTFRFHWRNPVPTAELWFAGLKGTISRKRSARTCRKYYRKSWMLGIWTYL